MKILEITNEHRSLNFKRWFGKSVIKDRNGNPLIAYHGTQSNIKVFNTPAWFTPSYEHADNFSGDWSTLGKRVPTSKVINVYLRIENPIYTDDWDVTEPNKIMLQKYKKWNDEGYDGIIFSKYDEIEYIIFSPTSVKSVDNIGSYSLTNPNIFR